MQILTTIYSGLRQRWVINLFGVTFLTCLLAGFGQLLSVANYKPFALPLSKGLTIGLLWLMYALCYLRIKPTAKITETITPTTQMNDKSAPQRFAQAFTSLMLELKHTVRKPLPSFIILGAEQAGKKSLLQQAAIALEPEQRMLESELTQRYLDIQLGENALFLTTASDYAYEQPESEQNWHWLTKFLAQQLAKRSVRAVLLTYSLPDLQQASTEQLRQQTQVWRSRIKVLQEQLGYCLPIYLVITKTDILMGFREFFANLSATEQQQAWGISLTTTAEFSQQYDELLKGLNQRVLARMQQNADETQRVIIAGFPMQMANLKERLATLLQALMQPNKYATNLMLQGLYFTSATQRGTAIDYVMGQLSAQFGLQQQPLTDTLAQQQPYFIKQLFNQVIMPRQIANVPTIGALKRRQRWVLASYLLLATTAMATSLLWYGNYQANKRQLQTLTNGLARYQGLTQAGDVNAAMQQLAQTAESLTRQASWLNQLGLNQANEATQAFAMAYHQQLQYIFLPALRTVLEQTLQSNLAQPAALYRPLKAYLMLGEPTHLQAAYLQDWFAHFLQQGLSDDAATATILQNALAALLTKPLPAQNLNQNLIAQVRQALNEVAPSQRAYNALQQQALARSQTQLNFDADTIAGFTQVFTGLPAHTVIPGLYTAAGYQQVYLKLYEPLIQASSADNWIFGETRVKPSSTATLTQQLQGLYFADYIGYWSSTLNQLHLKRFADLRQAAAGVKLLASPTSPLQQLLTLTTHNTYLATTSNVPNNIAQDFNGAITPYFANIQQLLQTDAQQSLSQLQQQLQGLYGYLAALLAAPNQQQACFLAAQTLIKQDAANPLVLLQQQLAQYPQPVQTWLKELVNQVAGFIFADAQAYLERQWQQQVYPVYSQSIQYHYPFGPRNQTEVTPADFATFFGPQGTLAKFNATYLQAFIDTNAKTWQLRDFAGQTLVIKTENLSALQQAAHFTQLFFKADGKLGADFNLTPINMSAQTAKAQLQLDNQQLLYRHDPQLGNHLSWPTDNSRLNLQLIDLNAERNILNFTGAWALFQWLQTCKTQPQSATQYSVKCQLNGRYISYSLQADSVNNPFSQLANLGVWSLPRTLG